jgi:hypothetical protein
MGLLDMAAPIASGGLSILGGNKATNIRRRGIRSAEGKMDQGFQQAQGYQQPIYDQALQNSQTLSQRNQAGDFSQPQQQAYQPGQFNWNSQSVFDDPEYQSQLKSGRNAIEGGASSQGTLFSGKTAQDLQKYGSDLFANRSDELYNRQRGQFENDRDFGFNAQNQAFDQNNTLKNQDFSRGLSLSSGLSGAAGNLSDLATQQGQNHANADLGVAGARAGNYEQAFGTAGNALESSVGSIGKDAGQQYLTQALGALGKDPQMMKVFAALLGGM